MEIDPEKTYYRAIKDSFLWKKGAILELDEDKGSEGGYYAIEDVWDVVENGDEYISAFIIENNPDWFERIYFIVDKEDVKPTTAQGIREHVEQRFGKIEIK